MITFKRTSAFDPHFLELVTDLDKELWVRYPFLQQHYAPHNKVDETARVILANENDTLIGCGCFRPMKGEESTLEIKRMYVVPAYRSKGLGKRILTELEKWAIEQNFVVAKLETGKNQPEAIAAYMKSGFQIIPNFPPYVDVNESICMKKLIKRD